MDLAEFFETHYCLQQLFGKSERTEHAYRLTIKAFGRTLGRPATLDDLNNEAIIRHMKARLHGKFRGNQPATANKDRNQLVALWNFAAKFGFKNSPPLNVPLLKEPERIPRAWLRTEIDQLFGAIGRLPHYVGDVPAKFWWAGVVAVGLDTGERIGGVQSALWPWLDGRWLEVPAESRKFQQRDRKYWLTQRTVEMLAKIRKFQPAKERSIFPWPYCQTYLWDRYKKILRDAGLPHGPRDSFHKLRKTHASVVHQAGLDAQDALDHQHRRTTRKYIDPRYELRTRPSEAIEHFLANPLDEPSTDEKKTG